MSPAFALENMLDSARAHIQMPSKARHLHRAAKPEGFERSGLAHSRTRGTLAVRMALALYHVVYVLTLRAFVKMFWIHARPVVAGMESEQAGSDRPSEFIGEHQSVPSPQLGAVPYLRVSSAGQATAPQVTSVSLRHGHGGHEVGQRLVTLAHSSAWIQAMSSLFVIALAAESVSYVLAIWVTFRRSLSVFTHVSSIPKLSVSLGFI